MKLGYTEFSFGYAFTENLIRSSASIAAGAPVFPNLVQEAQLGYDVHISLPGCPLFFQFKLPELMVKRSAAEISKHSLAGIRIPFFRMPLMRRDLSDQHKLLMKLEDVFPNAVFYASPGMENIHNFNEAYNAARVHLESVFFSPRNIGMLPDEAQHTVAYRWGLEHAWLCSEPQELVVVQFEAIVEKMQLQFSDQRFHTLEQTSRILREVIWELISPELRSAESAIRLRIGARRSSAGDRPDESPRTREVAEDLLVSRELVRVGLGLELVIAQPAM